MKHFPKHSLTESNLIFSVHVANVNPKDLDKKPSNVEDNLSSQRILNSTDYVNTSHQKCDTCSFPPQIPERERHDFYKTPRWIRDDINYQRLPHDELRILHLFFDNARTTQTTYLIRNTHKIDIYPGDWCAALRYIEKLANEDNIRNGNTSQSFVRRTIDKLIAYGFIKKRVEEYGNKQKKCVYTVCAENVYNKDRKTSGALYVGALQQTLTKRDSQPAAQTWRSNKMLYNSNTIYINNETSKSSKFVSSSSKNRGFQENPKKTSLTEEGQKKFDFLKKYVELNDLPIKESDLYAWMKKYQAEVIYHTIIKALTVKDVRNLAGLVTDFLKKEVILKERKSKIGEGLVKEFIEKHGKQAEHIIIKYNFVIDTLRKEDIALDVSSETLMSFLEKSLKKEVEKPYPIDTQGGIIPEEWRKKYEPLFLYLKSNTNLPGCFVIFYLKYTKRTIEENMHMEKWLEDYWSQHQPFD